MITRSKQLIAPSKLSLLVGIGSLATIAYLVLVGGGTFGELQPVPRLISSIVAAAFIGGYLWHAPTRADRLDKLVLVSVILFAGAALISRFPRQSLDAVLGALAFAAGLFVARGLLVEGRWRAGLVFVFRGLSLVLTLVTVARWLPQLIETASATNTLPALSLELPAAPWGYRYDLALLVAILYPAWWIGAPRPITRVTAAVIGTLVVGIVLITGSRTVWLALTIATLSLVWPVLRRHRSEVVKRWRVILVVVVLIGLGAYATGLVEPIIQRASNIASLGWRTAMWGPLIDAWWTHPLGGFGPGSFPWSLQLTDYFDTNSWPPRHPDNAIIQLLIEGGVLGLLGLLPLVLGVLPAVFRGQSASARWVIVAFGIACIGGNPSDFTFMVAVVAAWVAYAVPHDVNDRARTDQASAPRSPMRAATMAAFAVVVLAHATTHVAAFSYEGARNAVASTDFPGAKDALNIAVSLDPGMALYVRQRGILRYIEGDLGRATADLERATELNAADDLAWRALAMGYLARDSEDAGLAALATALALQRSDATNLLFNARAARQMGDDDRAVMLLAEAVQAWPAIVGARGWAEMLPPSVTTAEVVDAALDRWRSGEPMPELPSDQVLWLVAFADRPDLDDWAVSQTGTSPILGHATVAVRRCDPGAADILDQAGDDDRRNPLYQALRARVHALDTGSESATVDPPGTIGGSGGTLNPLDENGILSTDTFGYRRSPIAWPETGDSLPSPMDGLTRWTLFPRETVRTADLEDRLTLCRDT